MGKYEVPKRKRKACKGSRILAFLLLIFLLSGVIFASFGHFDQSKSGFQKLFSVFSFGPKEVKQETLGIDVARYQGTIDWEEAAQSGIDFAMIRLGYRTQVDGDIIEDSNARYNMQEAARSGIQIGAYFFSSAVTPDEAREEAAWIAQLVAQYPITYPIAYNCEGFLADGNRNSGMKPVDRTTIALAFLEAIEDYGYEGMFYASKNEMEGNAQWITSELEKDYKIWVAQYPEDPYPETKASDYQGEHSMWQYTTLGTVPGIEQNVDCDIAYFGYTKVKNPLDPTPPAEAEPDVEALMNFEAVDETVTAKEETNLRSLPSQGAESQVMYTLQHGETAQRIGISSAGWSKLRFEGNIYYAVSNFLTTNLNGPSEEMADEDGFDTVFTDIEDEEVTPKEAVNLRTMPSVIDEESKVIVQLKHGETAIRDGISGNGWSRLRYNDQVCYAVTSYLVGPNDTEAVEPDPDVIHTKFDPVSDKVTPKDAVNLRTRPTVTEGQSEVIVKVKHGEILDRTGINKDLGWSRVQYQDQELYCISAYLEEFIKN